MTYKYYYDDGKKVIAVSSYAGKSVKGIAKCNPKDSFDYDKGAELAKARCNAKIASKRVDRAVECRKKAYEEFEAAKKKVDKMESYYRDANSAFAKALTTLSEVERTM